MLKYRTAVTRKGQVTIPKEFRDELNLDEGESVEWFRDGDTLRLRRSGSIVERTFGAARHHLDGHHQSLTPEEERSALEDAHVEELRAKLSRS